MIFFVNKVSCQKTIEHVKDNEEKTGRKNFFRDISFINKAGQVNNKKYGPESAIAIRPPNSQVEAYPIVKK
jgi:hypothetical protein